MGASSAEWLAVVRRCETRRLDLPKEVWYQSKEPQKGWVGQGGILTENVD